MPMINQSRSSISIQSAMLGLRRFTLRMITVAIILANADDRTFAQDFEAPIPDATLTMSGNIVALGIGYVRAHGTLYYRGQTLTVWDVVYLWAN